MGLGIAVPGPGLPSDLRMKRRKATIEKRIFGPYLAVYPITVFIPIHIDMHVKITPHIHTQTHTSFECTLSPVHAILADRQSSS